jgi:hypothetical protein
MGKARIIDGKALAAMLTGRIAREADRIKTTSADAICILAMVESQLLD